MDRRLRKNPTKRDRFSPLLIESRGPKDIRVLDEPRFGRRKSQIFSIFSLFLTERLTKRISRPSSILS